MKILLGRLPLQNMQVFEKSIRKKTQKPNQIKTTLKYVKSESKLFCIIILLYKEDQNEMHCLTALLKKASILCSGQGSLGDYSLYKTIWEK